MDQKDLTPALERVAASVVETHRKRQQVEEDLKAAAAVIASLHSQSSSLEASVLTLRAELEQALQLKAQEDAELLHLAARRQAAVDQLDAIGRDIQTFLADKHRIAAEIATQTQAARARVHEVEGDAASVKSALLAFSEDTTALRATLAEVRKTAENVDGQIVDIQSRANDLGARVDGIASRISGIAEHLDRSELERQRLETPEDELRAVSAALEARRAEAQTAIQETELLLGEREKQASMLAQQIERLARLETATPAVAAVPAAAANRAYEAHRDAKLPKAGPARAKFSQTADLIQLLASMSFTGPEEATAMLEILRDEDVDKFVRSLWSRAMGGPQPGSYRLIIGTALGDSGDQKGAMTFFYKALEGKNADPMLTYLVAVALLRMSRQVDVQRIAQGLGRAKNGRMLARNLEALQLEASGQPEEAENKLVEALSLPPHPRAHASETMYNLAQLAQRRGDAGTAAMWFEKLTVADPAYRDAAIHMESSRVDARGR